MIFDPEDGGDIVLRKVRLSPNYLPSASVALLYWLTGLSPYCTALQPSRSVG
jgi:hypothetical protein